MFPGRIKSVAQRTVKTEWKLLLLEMSNSVPVKIKNVKRVDKR